ncbi:MAG: CRISPR-associated endonuclease Cas1 [Succinivibrionaceae bacterium]|nr:CRISPR-associated endonuclease Cas1 [Succinivibrionaceae bacterium]
MRHLTISEYGSFLGITGERIVVKQDGAIILEKPLSRIRSISILKNGVSISSDLISACAIRGIKLFFLDWRGRIASALIGQNQHAVVALRKSQFAVIDCDEQCCSLAKTIIASKIKNQRAVVRYFYKYQSKGDNGMYGPIISSYLKLVDDLLNQFEKIDGSNKNWRNLIFGVEGKSAKLYWETLSSLNLLSDDFLFREGRNAFTMTNKALNYGYAILLGYVWSAIDNAGLEVYAGVLHTDRPGKPSLVLDLMEEYRAWVVDRVIIKMRDKLSKAKSFDFAIKKLIVEEIHETMLKTYNYNKKKVKLENILQRQVYRFSGSIASNKKYKGYIFKW